MMPSSTTKQSFAYIMAMHLFIYESALIMLWLNYLKPLKMYTPYV